MEALEIAIFIGAAILVGGVLLATLNAIDYNSLYKRFTKTEEPQFTVPQSDVALYLVKAWINCGYGEVPGENRIYIPDEGVLTRDNIFRNITKNNHCPTIGCPPDESVLAIPDSIQLPKVINIKCTSDRLIVE